MAGSSIADAETLSAGLPTGGVASGGGEIIADRYELLGLLGAGAMGRVYRARDRELDEVVALKVLHRDLLASEGMVARFRQEVKLARRVTHRNVARTFDIGEHGGEKFLTMEYVEGEPLSAVLARTGPMPCGDALAIASDLCAGMAAAHASGVIHRDLKPDNVLVARDGRVVVTDFGVARTHLPGSPKATSGKAIGTPTYMAPEQVEAASDIDGRADIYAFGAMLFEMLTGRVAWPGESPYLVAAARLFQPPPDPRSLRADLPEGVASLVLRCLARSRADRPASSAELLASVEAARAEVSGRTTGERSPAPAPGKARRREKTVAVLPFRNAGPPEDAYVADGITEDLVDVLSKVRDLRVRGRVSPGADADVAATGRRLGVDVVIDGALRRAGDRLRVSARVVSSEDGFQIWAGRFERSLRDAFALNDEVARAIGEVLSASTSVAIRAMPGDPGAIELYLRAKHEGARAWGTDPRLEMELWEKALASAPDDPTTLAGFVAASGRWFFTGAEVDPQRLEALVDRAIRAAPRQPEPWHALAVFRYNAHDDPAGAIRALKRAIEEAPSSADAHDLAGRLLLEAGDALSAAQELERSLWLDPMLNFWTRVDLMRLHALAGRVDVAEGLAAERDDPMWQAQRAINLSRFALWYRRALPDGVLDLKQEPQRSLIALYDGVIRGRPYDRDNPFASMMRKRSPPRSRGARLLTQIEAEFAAYMGKHDDVRSLLEQGADEGIRDLAWLGGMPLFAPYRGEAWFQRVLDTFTTRARPVIAAWFGPPEPLPPGA